MWKWQINIIKNTKKDSCERYQNLSEKEKKQKAKKVPERHQIFTEEEKEDKCQY